MIETVRLEVSLEGVGDLDEGRRGKVVVREEVQGETAIERVTN